MGEGSYITLFSPSDVTEVHRIRNIPQSAWSVQVVVHLGCGVYCGLLFKLYAECLYSTRGLLWKTLLSITSCSYQTMLRQHRRWWYANENCQLQTDIWFEHASCKYAAISPGHLANRIYSAKCCSSILEGWPSLNKIIG